MAELFLNCSLSFLRLDRISFDCFMKIRIKSDIALSKTGFVFNPQTGESFSLNPMGSEIICLLRDGYSTEEVVKSITDRFDVSAHSFSTDLDDFVAMLRRYELTDEA